MGVRNSNNRYTPSQKGWSFHRKTSSPISTCIQRNYTLLASPGELRRSNATCKARRDTVGRSGWTRNEKSLARSPMLFWKMTKTNSSPLRLVEKPSGTPSQCLGTKVCWARRTKRTSELSITRNISTRSSSGYVSQCRHLNQDEITSSDPSLEYDSLCCGKQRWIRGISIHSAASIVLKASWYSQISLPKPGIDETQLSLIPPVLYSRKLGAKPNLPSVTQQRPSIRKNETLIIWSFLSNVIDSSKSAERVPER